jgi:hypothetical protein
MSVFNGDVNRNSFSPREGELPPPTITYHGLNCWYTHIVEKIGWVIAHKDDYSNRLKWYIETVDILLRKINEWENLGDNTAQIKQDLRVMKDVLTNLRIAATKLNSDRLQEQEPGLSLDGGARRKSKTKKVSKSKKTKKLSKTKKASKTRKH